MSKWFMLHKGEHHKVDEDLYLHYEDTCNIHEVFDDRTRIVWADRSTAENKTRLYPSRFGWVATLYETKGVITFSVQIDQQYAAWQRREWPANFDQNWDDKIVQKAIENFLWVAKCETTKKRLPKND